MSDTPTTVVGVLPAAFRFPSIFEVRQPLAIDETVAPRAGTGLDIWARLKSGVTRTQANIELAALAARTASDWPATHAHLRAIVESPAVSKMKEPGERAAIASFNLGIGLIVLLVSGNVALLMFARAATRESEILVRIALGLGAVTLSTLVLALSGIYAVMSFAVSRRTREIGIRVALGSQQWRVVLTILRRQLIHLSIGIAVGGLFAFWISSANGVTVGLGVGVAGYALIMLGVCLLACIVPVRRVLKVDPIAALRAE